jgi:hypothetical protein
MLMNQIELNEMFDRMVANWPSEIVARAKVEEFTGGLLTGKTVANIEADKTKVGPEKIRIGRRAGYPKAKFVEWLKTRTIIKPCQGPA